MKKFIIAFLTIAFLLPAFAYAGSYCVSFPTSGGSRMTKRDNTAGVKFRFDYEATRIADDKLHWYRYERGHNRFPSYPKKRKFSFERTGYITGSGNVSRNGVYKYYGNGTSELCIDNPLPSFRSLSDNHTANVYRPDLKQVRLDVKFGGDCEKVAVKDGQFTGDNRFELYRRKSDWVNPWGCRRK